MAAWQHGARRLEAWLDDQYDRGHLAVTDGPFADDPAAAVATTAAALQDTRRACLDLQAGLERAQMAITDLTAPDRGHHPTRTQTSRRFRHGH